VLFERDESLSEVAGTNSPAWALDDEQWAMAADYVAKGKTVGGEVVPPMGDV
jgi:hypothetical protein